MPMILRLIKGSELTFAELDGNFTDLDNRTDALEALNLGTRVTKLEAAGTPLFYDSDDTGVILDSIWSGAVASYLATTDSIGLASYDSSRFSLTDGHVSLIEKIASADSVGLASFDSTRFSVTNGHVSWIERLATKDSDGTASFDSSNFVVTSGHVTINPLSAAGRVAGITPIDSTGVASFDSDNFNVSSDGHVTLELATTSSVGVASFNSNDFTVSAGGEVSSTSGGAGVGAVGTYALLTTKTNNNHQPNAATFAEGATAAGSLLKTTSTSGDARYGATQTGTWRAMGNTIGAVGGGEFATLFLRIA